ncbi:CPBP family intramembrane glutamic endopeptidase [Sinomonas sp. ASV322]|uniref:CPBP family intramembrane glutamic endopeptidase n=1 Tax=Sinomonas sp. ASV322 TaxID=3041920 RepID=UPI0027DD5159|nr:CPBP family intramembrane glutamic endopeptidase [Sinomonas sp. ASV322]MDQ4502973.1 CPBP family intramembrane glutamic endopeptidase [Sinomonas sp. ASV322]
METIAALRVRRLTWAGLGIVATLACGLAAENWAPRDNPHVSGLLAYLAAWLPMLAALTLAMKGNSFRQIVSYLGIRVHAMDIFWGLGLACAARAADGYLQILLTGSTGLESQPTLGAVVSGSTLVTGVVAPVIIAPLLEEFFFRGLIQRTLTELLRPRSAFARATVAVVVTSLVFAAIHVLLLARTPTELAALAAGTFIFSVGAGIAAAATSRLGAAMVGHVVFNGLGVWLTWPV